MGIEKTKRRRVNYYVDRDLNNPVFGFPKIRRGRGKVLIRS